jgi:hypothetical protein
MRLTVRANVLLVICAIAGWFAIFVLGRSSVNLEQGELRCESPGAVIINVWGDIIMGSTRLELGAIPRYSAFGTTQLILKPTLIALLIRV